MEYFKSDGKFIYLEAEYAEFYIPKYYFDDTGKFAEDLGSTVRALGVFDVGFFSNGQLKEMRVLNIPTWTDFFVNDSEDRNVSLPRDEEGSVPCKVLKFNKGHRIISSSIVEDSSNAESYLDFVLKGKVPSIVPYSKSIQIWRKNKELNSVHLGVPSVIEEMILSCAYRDMNNPSRKFAEVIGKDPKVSQYDYIMNNIRQICQYSSTFAGITFEDIDSMITTAINRTRTKGMEQYSPIEELLKL